MQPYPCNNKEVGTCYLEDFEFFSSILFLTLLCLQQDKVEICKIVSFDFYCILMAYEEAFP